MSKIQIPLTAKQVGLILLCIPPIVFFIGFVLDIWIMFVIGGVTFAAALMITLIITCVECMELKK